MRVGHSSRSDKPDSLATAWVYSIGTS